MPIWSSNNIQLLSINLHKPFAELDDVFFVIGNTILWKAKEDSGSFSTNVIKSIFPQQTHSIETKCLTFTRFQFNEWEYFSWCWLKESQHYWGRVSWKKLHCGWNCIILYLVMSQSLDVAQSSAYCLAITIGARHTLAPPTADTSHTKPDSQSASRRQSSPNLRP